MKTTSHRVQSGNLTLSANCYGSAENTPILLVHGYPDDSTVWHKLIPFLADDFYVITYDVRGCGRSDTPPSRKHYGMRYLYADQINVIKALSPNRPVHLVGHDWGSIQSWETATEPGIEQLVASYTTISGPCLDHVGMGLKDSFATNPLASFSQLLHSWYIGFFHLPLLAPLLWKAGLDKAWPALVDALEDVTTDASPLQQRNGVNGINLYRANIIKHLFSPRERVAQVPVQAIVALRDSYVTAPLLENMGDWAHHLQRHELDVTHWGAMLEKPEQTAQLVRHFVLQQTSGGSTEKSLSSMA